MIDDINPSEPIEDELIQPEKLLTFIDTLKPENKENRKLLMQKNIIWVLGNKQCLDDGDKDKWQEMLVNIGVAKHKITTVSL